MSTINNNSAKNVLENSVRNTVESFCSSYSNHLSAWLAEKKSIDISPDELCEAFGIAFRAPQTPSVPSGASVQTKMPNLPDYYSGTGAAVTPKKKGGRTKKTADPNSAICKYITTRGKTPGKRCETPVAGDGSTGADEYCKACLKKAAVIKLLSEGSSTKTTVQPPVLPGSTVEISEDNTTQTNEELQVVQIQPGVFREVKHGFILRQQEDGNVVAYAIEEQEGVTRDLSDSEKKVALAMGIQVINTNTIPQIPQIPQVQSLKLPSV